MTGSAAAPARVRMTRAAPWRPQHPDAVIVDRRSPWGNLHTVARVPGSSVLFIVTSPNGQASGPLAVADAHQEAVDRFRAGLRDDPARVGAIRAHLAGRELACWCAPHLACHADVLLDVAAGHAP